MQSPLRIFGALVVGCMSTIASQAAPTSDLLYEWVFVNYTWPNASMMDQYLSTGLWKPENNIITGIKYYKGVTYLTVPRWKSGVPATLNTVVNDPASGLPLLQPFPSWESQDISSVTGIKYTQSMEITPDGTMWILDVGRLNIFEPAAGVVNGAPKLVLYDLNGQQPMSTYVFTDDVASYTASFLNDLVIDITTQFAYISDSGTGAIVVYDRQYNTARRFSDITTQANLSVPFAINGINYPTISTPVDGIALSPDRSTLYYCALRGNALYALPTNALRDFSRTNAELSAMVKYIGYKPPSDGMTFSNEGILYFGSLIGDAVLQWVEGQPLTSQSVLTTDYSAMQWQDTFAWGENGKLLFTTNRLQLYFAGTMNFNGSDGANMRVFQTTVDATAQSYMANMPPYSPQDCKTHTIFDENSGLKVAIGVMSVLFVVAAAYAIYLRGKVRVSKPGNSDLLTSPLHTAT